jgi:LPXTG-motif cell wall-anchored protein
MLENASGELVPYYQGTYYIHDDEGVYYRYEGGVLVPNGQTAYPCTAGNNGTISHVPPDFTVEIRELVAGTDFYVDEIRVRPNGGNLDASDDVLIGDSDWELVSTTVENEDPSEISDADIWDYSTGKNIKGSSMGRIAWGEKDAQVTFTNKYTSTDVALKKVDDKGNTLSGASFDLTRFANNVWSNVQTGISPGAPATADSEEVPNPVDLGALDVGRYRLEEKVSPDGYIILSKFVYFEVYKDTDKQVKVRFTDENGTPLTDAQIEELSGTAILTPASGDDPYTITIKNIPGEELPMTGGIGTTIFYILGSILVVGCGLVLIARKRAGISR